jgi:flavin-dependent dehydrogenase
MFTADVVIVGGGPAGAAVALALARRGLTPIVLEAQSTPQRKVGEFLSPNINPLLDHFELTDRLRRGGNLRSHGNRFVWGWDSINERDFIFGTGGDGWRLDRRTFEEELMRAAVEAGVDWRYGRRLAACSREKLSRFELIVTGPGGVETYRADFVVDCTGRNAHLARSLGARRVVYDRLVGIASYFPSFGDGDRPATLEDDSFTLVEAVSSGWWYSSRLPGGKLIAVYMTDGDLFDRDARRTGGWFKLLKLAKHTAARVAEYGGPPTVPRVLPAHSVRLTSVAGDGWLAAGDAAIGFDPLASHGISMAMGGGFHAASVIVDYLSGRLDGLGAYKRIIDRAFAHYLLMRRDAYLVERRWLTEPFWRRRQAPASAADVTSPGFTISHKSDAHNVRVAAR